MKQLNALNTKVIVKLTNEQTVTEGGIALPSTKDPHMGTVVSVGKEVADVNQGDVVIINPFEGSMIRHQGTEYFICDNKKLLASLH